MHYCRLISTSQPILIPLIHQNKDLQKHFNQNHKGQSQPSQKCLSSQYIFEVILISKDIVCTVSRSHITLYSLMKTQQQLDNQNRCIGRVDVYGDLERLLVERENLFFLQHNKNKDVELDLEKSFESLSIVQQKGILYHQSTNTFYLLLESVNNKYLVTFTVDIDCHLGKESLQKIDINDFSVMYNFNQQSSQVKYSLELSPQILLLGQSSTLVLIRKFYSDSFVVVFKDQEGEESDMQLTKDQLQVSEEDIQQTVQQMKQDESMEKTKQEHKRRQKIHWSFYINEECLSNLDDFIILVNFRQLITKNYVDIDLIDIDLKEKLTVRISEAIEPMTIKSVQLVGKIKGANMNQQQYKLRVFAVLKRSQTTLILDYDLVHSVVERTYRMEGVFLQSVSFLDASKEYCYIYYLYEGKGYIGLLREDMSALNDQKLKKNFIKQLIGNSVQLQLDSFCWNIESELILQSKISLRNSQLMVKLSKPIDKGVYFIKVIDQLKKRNQLFKDDYFSQLTYRLLNDKSQQPPQLQTPYLLKQIKSDD